LGKGNKERIVIFSDELKNLIKNFIKDNEYLFISLRRKWITPRMIQVLFKKLSKLVMKSFNITPIEVDLYWSKYTSDGLAYP
jgi:site-specific recombinase XerD